MGVQLRMLGTAQVSCLLLVAATAQGQADPEQGAEAPDFRCPEKNGKFRDFEQCDLFYICRKDVATIEFCPEGLLFDDKIPNHEKCVLPHNVLRRQNLRPGALPRQGPQVRESQW